jgi:hypothetical protein
LNLDHPYLSFPSSLDYRREPLGCLEDFLIGRFLDLQNLEHPMTYKYNSPAHQKSRPPKICSCPGWGMSAVPSHNSLQKPCACNPEARWSLLATASIFGLLAF